MDIPSTAWVPFPSTYNHWHSDGQWLYAVLFFYPRSFFYSVYCIKRLGTIRLDSIWCIWVDLLFHPFPKFWFTQFGTHTCPNRFFDRAQSQRQSLRGTKPERDLRDRWIQTLLNLAFSIPVWVLGNHTGNIRILPVKTRPKTTMVE